MQSLFSILVGASTPNTLTHMAAVKVNGLFEPHRCALSDLAILAAPGSTDKSTNNILPANKHIHCDTDKHRCVVNTAHVLSASSGSISADEPTLLTNNGATTANANNIPANNDIPANDIHCDTTFARGIDRVTITNRALYGFATSISNVWFTPCANETSASFNNDNQHHPASTWSQKTNVRLRGAGPNTHAEQDAMLTFSQDDGRLFKRLFRKTLMMTYNNSTSVSNILASDALVTLW